MSEYYNNRSSSKGGTSIISIVLVVLTVLINLTDMNILQMNWGNFATSSLYSWLSFMENGVFHFGGLLLSLWTILWMSIVCALPIIVLVMLIGFLITLIFRR